MKTIVFAILLIPVLASAQIGAKTQQGNKLVGIWQNSQFGYQMTLLLNADGSGEFDGETIKYTNQANKLSLVQNGQTTVYTYVLQGNNLTLSGGDIEGNIVFTLRAILYLHAVVARTHNPCKHRHRLLLYNRKPEAHKMETM